MPLTNKKDSKKFTYEHELWSMIPLQKVLVWWRVKSNHSITNIISKTKKKQTNLKKKKKKKKKKKTNTATERSVTVSKTVNLVAQNSRYNEILYVNQLCNPHRFVAFNDSVNNQRSMAACTVRKSESYVNWAMSIQLLLQSMHTNCESQILPWRGREILRNLWSKWEKWPVSLIRIP
jgi:hypothetical protein